ncbi:S-layer homology domain-containing protein [Brevibacillus sp. SAFN-007a]|uniref:S-layer homology domain-containing protein n=1 Tax=Brevibacillus sp. SAFN-007a TaxID=3436862 RepID=UPI003F7D68F9
MQIQSRRFGKITTVWTLVLSIAWTGTALGEWNQAQAQAKQEVAVASTGSFLDIKGHWAAKEMELAARNGLIQGFPDGTFQPEKTVTQEQFLALVERVLPSYQGHEPDAFVRETYIAKASGRWSEQTYRHLAAAGIMTTGKPTDGMTRMEAARLLLAALGHQSEGEKYRGTTARFFSDLSPENEHEVMTVYPAYKMGLLFGYPDGTFRPKDTITRAQAVVLLARLDSKRAELFPGQVTESEKTAMTDAVAAFVRDVMDVKKIRRYDDLVAYVKQNKRNVSESFLQEHFSFMKYEIYDFVRFPQFNELLYFAKIGTNKYRLTVQYYAGELGGSVDKTFYLSSLDGKTFRLIGKDE